MCLVLFAWKAHPDHALILAANRDEFYSRPTAPAAPWPEAPNVVAGRDRQGGGTWLGVTRTGRWAAITNFRDPREFSRQGPSRGGLVAEYLRTDRSPSDYVESVAADADEYNGFNLLVGDSGSVWWFSNRAPDAAGPVDAGVHGLSNALLDTPWPKVTRGKRELSDLLSGPAPDSSRLLEILMDRTLAADHGLPDTGVGPELERALSASFILTPGYGTRSSTALLIGRNSTVELVERTFTPGTTRRTEIRYQLGPDSHAGADDRLPER